MAGSTFEHGRSQRNIGVMAAWALLGIVATWVAFTTTADAREGTRDCAPITFEVVGSPPPFVRTELELAMEEIHERSGFVFEEETEPVAGERPQLSIFWAVGETPSPRPDMVVPHDREQQRLGFGMARWRHLPNRRELLEGVVEVDGSLAWGQGLGSADALAATFVHELGHVIGLQHSADAASFMYPRARKQTPTWSTEDASQLKWFGRQSGCEPS